MCTQKFGRSQIRNYRFQKTQFLPVLCSRIFFESTMFPIKSNMYLLLYDTLFTITSFILCFVYLNTTNCKNTPRFINKIQLEKIVLTKSVSFSCSLSYFAYWLAICNIKNFQTMTHVFDWLTKASSTRQLLPSQNALQLLFLDLAILAAYTLTYTR